jgi:prevent-host-death family protein
MNVHNDHTILYSRGVDVPVTALRSELARWIDQARSGEEIVITDRGVPVARLVPVDTAPLIERLTRDGVLAHPSASARPKAGGATRVPSRGSVSDLVGEQRR